MTDPLAFALAVLALLATPGPTNALLALSGSGVGIRRSLPLVLAEAAGYLVSVLTVGLLAAPFLAAHPGATAPLRLALAAYLGHLAARLWMRRQAPGPRERMVTVRQLFATTLLNPKGLVLALAVFPFGKAPLAPYMAGFLAVLAAASVSWIALGRALGAGGGRVRAAMPRVAAGAIAAFAVAVAAPALTG